MAYLYQRVRGKTMEDFIANLDGVQDILERTAFEAMTRAEETLKAHRYLGHAAVEVVHGDVDWYVVLSDDRGQKAALSIEYGHSEYERDYIDKRTGEVRTVTIGASEGLYVLAGAFKLPKKRKGKVKL